MARAFVSASSQGLQASLSNNGLPNQLSLSFWLKWTSFANDDKLAFELSANTNSVNGGFFVDPDSSTFAGSVQLTANMTSNSVVTISRPSAAVWHHWLVLIDLSQTTDALVWPAVYIDGVSQTISNNGGTGRTPTNFPATNFNFMCRNQASLFADGSMADVAMWIASNGNRGGALLTQGEATALARGVRPHAVRPTSLGYWWPLDGLQSPEPDIGHTARNASLTGSPTLDSGPPASMITPRQMQYNFLPALFSKSKSPIGGRVYSRQALRW